MPLELHKPQTMESVSILGRLSAQPMTEHSGSREDEQWFSFAPGYRTLAASPEAGRLEYQIARAAFQASSVTQLDLIVREFPVLVPEECFADLDSGDGADRQLFIGKLRRAFDDLPLEDGHNHPAESLLAETISSTGATALEWVRGIVLDRESPAFGASVLRCLGRLKMPGDPRWRSEIIGDALGSDNVELRDAAVQAVETWEDKNLLAVLQRHEEPVSWLEEYVGEVMQDLLE